MPDWRANVGCGRDLRGDYDVFVDRYIEPVSRMHTGNIEVPPGKRFVVADIEALPFLDKSFAFAECKDVLEHVERPDLACAELQRVAKSGYILCPGVFDEMLFGRVYHLWMTMMRGRKVWFFRKRPWEDRPFGNAVRDAIIPLKLDFVPATPELRQIKQVFEEQHEGPRRLFGQEMWWQGGFECELVG